MAPAILNTLRSTLTAHLAARSDLSPMAAHALLTARERIVDGHIAPGEGLIPPQKINNNAVFAIFGIIGAGFVVVGIWFFFWAKNGGFYFKENDWDDYKSTVLRRKGPNGTTLSGATESTVLGGGSVYKDVDDNATEDASTVISGTTGITGITGGVSDFSGREKRRRKREQKEREKERRREEKSREKEEKRKSRRKVGADNIIIDPEAEQQATEQLRSYRHEKPARVGGINRESEASEWDGSTNPSWSNASGSRVDGDYSTVDGGSTVTSDLMGNRERTPTKPKAAAAASERTSERSSGGIRKVYSTADKNASRENERLRAEARRMEKERQRASRRDFSWAGADETMALRRIDEQSEQSESLVSGSNESASLAPESRIPGAWAAESSVGTASDVGTKVYKHSVHIPVSNESTVSTDFAYADEKRKKRGGAGARRRAADAESSVAG